MINEEIARKTLNMEVRAGKVTGKILLDLIRKLLKESEKNGGLEKLVGSIVAFAFLYLYISVHVNNIADASFDGRSLDKRSFCKVDFKLQIWYSIFNGIFVIKISI